MEAILLFYSLLFPFICSCPWNEAWRIKREGLLQMFSIYIEDPPIENRTDLGYDFIHVFDMELSWVVCLDFRCSIGTL